MLLKKLLKCSFSRVNILDGKLNTFIQCFSTSPSPEPLYESILQRNIGRTKDEQNQLKLLSPQNLENAKTIKVTIIGLPNSGKSTLINSLMQWRISSVSSKVHTTRKNIISTFTEENKQIIYFDTPGLVDKKHCQKHNLEIDMASFPHFAAKQGDIICVVVDANNFWTRHSLDRITLDILQEHRSKPSILVLNKVDLVKPKSLVLDVVKSLTDNHFRGRKMPGVMVKTDNESQQKLVDPNVKTSAETIKNKDDNEDMKIMANLNELERVRYSNRVASLKREGRDGLANHGEENVHVDSKKLPHKPSNSLVYTNFSDVKISRASHAQQTGIEEDVSVINEKVQTRMKDKHASSWPNFEEVFMISSIDNDGTDQLKEYLLSAAPAKPWTYNSRFVTDQVPEDIVYDAIKQELLQEFKFQIPYILDIKLDEYFVDEFGLFRIKASIKCPKQNLIKVIIGPKGERIKGISQRVSQNLMNTFRTDLYLSLGVKYRPL
ncbi:unnamed protein product [Gordionus sp. m RMFG-2023]|uniref:GTPase Era, mitochondrial-like n=1 Tax=Gordionus sp. m RMFG-2023 TaxID=3053472 RepID=UPI0030DFB922